jgi:putative acetyltransferase
MVSITPVSTEADIADTRDLLREYTTWALTLVADLERPPTFEGLEEELATLPGIYVPPAGRLLLARHEGQAAGCIALKPHSAGAGELKRLYVRPAFRGLAIGRHDLAYDPA